MRPGERHSPSHLSRGTYGAKVGVPRVLELLDKYQLPSTFFVPGWVAEHHPRETQSILAAGHEIAHHGYLHSEKPVDMTPEAEEEALLQGIRALQTVTGTTPVGYRCPGGRISDQTFRLLSKHGFLYDSSMMDDERPYIVNVPETGRRLVELPAHFDLDDAPYFLFTFSPTYLRGLYYPDHVYDIWAKEFDGYYRERNAFILMLHPQIIARHSRIDMLERLIRYMRGHTDVQFATHQQIAESFARSQT